MTVAAQASIEQYEEQYEQFDSAGAQREPRPFRKSPQRLARRARTARLGIKGRNRSRTVARTM